MQPASEEDWHHYHRIRSEQIFAHYTHLVYDPHHPTLRDPAHFHFLLKKPDAVVGVAHVELLDGNRAALRPFAIDAPYQNKGYGSQFLELVEKWVMHKGRSTIQLHAKPLALSFYQRAGYETHPFVETTAENRDYLERAKIGGASYIDLKKILRY
ncbi:MAG: GNAT family N-acetyltransferase [Alphaproteobacteria bacterium]